MSESSLPFSDAPLTSLPVQPPSGVDPSGVDVLSHGARNIAFIDAGVTAIDTLMQGLENTQVVLIDGDRDGIAQMTSALEGVENLEAIHIFSHGADGLLQLGNTLLSNANVEDYGERFRQWSAALTAEADLMIYGCHLAVGAEGLSLMHRLGELTGADVAASDDVTGAGGDWELEASTGEIESPVALSAAIQATYEGSLSLLTNGDFESGLSGWRTLRGTESITTDAVSGSSALEIGGTSRGVRQTLSAVAGETYRLTGSGKTTSGGNTTVGITFYDQAGDRVGGRARKVRSTDWDEFVIEQEAPAGTQSVRVWAYKSNDTGSFFLDDLELNTGTVEPPEPPVPGAQLLLNSGFEAGLNRWQTYQGTERAVNSGAFAGTRALRLSTAGSGARQIVDAIAGETYEISGYAKSSSDGYVGFGVTFYDAAGAKINGSGAGRSVRSADWQLYESEAIAPDNARFARFWTYKRNDNGDGFLDQLSLRVAGAVTPEPGNIRLETSTISADEGDGTVRVRVDRTDGSDGEITVDYSTVAGSAAVGTDFEAVSGTLTFADGQAQQFVDITLLDDNTPEDLETFAFVIDNVQGGANLLAPRTAQISVADNDGFTYRGNQYVTTTAKTWLQAQAEAEQLGGNLVSINTAQEESWLKQTFGSTEGFWIGLNDIETEGQFKWASGEQVGYTNWALGEPNDGGPSGSQDYGWMNFGSSRQWDDNSSEAVLRGIVEIGDYNGPVLGQGNGLKGEYYNNIDFTDLALERTDARVNFDWGEGSPNSRIGNDTFSVRWSGRIEPLYSETYTFQTTSDDGVRLWVNDQLIIDEFQDQPPTSFTGSISLNAGQQYDIRLEYYENLGGAVSQLAWSSASQAFQIVPRSQLYSDPVDSRTLNSETVISAGLSQPTAIDWLTDGSNTMFIAEKGGVVKVFENGRLLNNPFIDISAQVNGTRDRGLLDLAIHPDFVNNPYIYLLFTYDPPEVFNFSGDSGPDGNNNRAARLIRVTADAANGYRTAIAGSEVVLLGKNSTWDNFNGQVNSTFDFNEPPAGILPDGSSLQDFLNADSESHTIGAVEFGPDGALYVSNGDGASYNRVDPRATRVQDIDNLSGKVLRINPITGRGLADNPFYNGDADANRSKVYQLGLRNPFRMAVDPNSGKVYTGDVGWTSWEEINAGDAGANFGWPFYEGGDDRNLPTGGYGNLPEAQAFYNSNTAEPAFFGLDRSVDGINAIVMGDVYTGDAYPDRYKGDVFFGDLGQGIIRNINLDANGEVSSVETFANEDPFVVQMAQGPDDLLYFVNLFNGTVSRWVFE